MCQDELQCTRWVFKVYHSNMCCGSKLAFVIQTSGSSPFSSAWISRCNQMTTSWLHGASEPHGTPVLPYPSVTGFTGRMVCCAHFQMKSLVISHVGLFYVHIYAKHFYQGLNQESNEHTINLLLVRGCLSIYLSIHLSAYLSIYLWLVARFNTRL